VALVAATAVVSAQQNLRIVPIVHDDQVLLSFELAEAFTGDVREAISSGLRTTFTYDVQLRMTATFWIDRTVTTMVVSASDEFDNLTRRHTLLRTVDGRVDGTLVTDDESVVRRWLTTFDRLPLYTTARLDPSRDYYVRIRARSQPQSESLLGWVNATTASARFTLIP
jgi:hypothetical protein